MTISLLSCSPKGWINSPQGSDRLRTAIHVWSTEGNRPVLVIALANSILPCSIPDYEDPDQQQDALRDLSYSTMREGARIVGIRLFSWDTDDWTGVFPVSELPDPDAMDALDSHMAQALYVGVNEAVISEEQGLFRTYTPTDVDSFIWVEEPGRVEIDRAEEKVEGRFYLDSIDVSGSFRSEDCGSDGSIIEWIGLLKGMGRDTAFVDEQSP